MFEVDGFLGLFSKRVSGIEDRRVGIGLEFFEVFGALVYKAMDVDITVKDHVTVGQGDRLFIVLDEFAIPDVQQFQRLTKGLALLLKQ